MPACAKCLALIRTDTREKETESVQRHTRERGVCFTRHFVGTCRRNDQ